MRAESSRRGAGSLVTVAARDVRAGRRAWLHPAAPERAGHERSFRRSQGAIRVDQARSRCPRSTKCSRARVSSWDRRSTDSRKSSRGYTGTRYCIGVESGTAALKVALEALGIGAGDEVILPANTYIASAIAVSAVGATSVFVDDGTTTISSTRAPSKPRSRRAQRRHAGAPLRPDGADAADPRYCAPSRACASSKTRANRTARAGTTPRRQHRRRRLLQLLSRQELGMLRRRRRDRHQRRSGRRAIRLLRDFGQNAKYEHAIKGDNCRLDSIQAAVLERQAASSRRMERRAPRQRPPLRRRCSPRPVSRCRSGLADEGHVYHLYVTEVAGSRGVQSDSAARHSDRHPLSDTDSSSAGVSRACGIVKGRFPKTEAAAKRILSLPMFPELTRQQIEYVVEALTDAVELLRHRSTCLRELSAAIVGLGYWGPESRT